MIFFSTQGDSVRATAWFIIRLTMWRLVSWYNCHWASGRGSSVGRSSSYASTLPDPKKSPSTSIPPRGLHPRTTTRLYITVSGQRPWGASLCPWATGASLYEAWCYLCREGKLQCFQ